MKCRVCSSSLVIQMPSCLNDRSEEDTGGPWWRCVHCGSDSSERSYDEVSHIYSGDYDKKMAGDLDKDQLRGTYTTNVTWLNEKRESVPDNTFLDVGHLAGVALDLMSENGWSVHGFDVHPRWNQGSHTTIAREFKASLFRRAFSAVMCREVIEHVPDWRDLIAEMFKATLPGGLCQIQTPCPWWPMPGDEPLMICYQTGHLQIISPAILVRGCRDAGFYLEFAHLWDGGQMVLLRRPS